MRSHALLGVRRHTVRIPGHVWQRHVRGGANLQFMTVDHHRVRDFCVMEIARLNRPVTPDHIGRVLRLGQDALVGILDDLERNMTFLYRNEDGAVTWAYPVTSDLTPHLVTFRSGEQVHAA
jgi:hypothetical protein